MKRQSKYNFFLQLPLSAETQPSSVGPNYLCHRISDPVPLQGRGEWQANAHLPLGVKKNDKSITHCSYLLEPEPPNTLLPTKYKSKANHCGFYESHHDDRIMRPY